jgi:VanZ family protein
MMGAIFIASGIPELTTLPGGVSDKTGHFAAYALLGALVLRAMARARMAEISWRRASVAWLVAAAYGATDEWHQSFVPGRFAAMDDWLADAAGSAAAVFLLVLVAAARTRRDHKV